MSLDPVWRHAQDVTSRHADAHCTVYAFGMPEDMPNAEEPRVQWVELVVCAEYEQRPLLDDDEDCCSISWATDWIYYAYITDDAGDTNIDDSGGDDTWLATEPEMLRMWYAMREQQGHSTPLDEAGDHAYRRAVGLAKNPVKARLLRWR